ncbi:hypothetical protein BDR26DRAFT_125594 [Obelidium mucronatum]|nr:hypothetical protein BDR26DRAFT_125594 [Obelidium mucronatum]
MQNKASRKYRERKEQYVKDLELAVAELSKQGSKPTEELRNRITALEAENSMLRQVTFSFDPLQATVDLIPATHQQQVSTAAGGQLPIATEDLFASSDFTVPHFHFDTFKQTQVDINFESLFSETELSDILTSSTNSPNNNNQALESAPPPVWTPTQVIEKLVNTPLPTPPSDDQVIEPHFSGARRALEKLPSLQSALNLVDELIKLYCFRQLQNRN